MIFWMYQARDFQLLVSGLGHSSDFKAIKMCESRQILGKAGRPRSDHFQSCLIQAAGRGRNSGIEWLPYIVHIVKILDGFEAVARMSEFPFYWTIGTGHVKETAFAEKLWPD
jgi:hypothetical protein